MASTGVEEGVTTSFRLFMRLPLGCVIVVACFAGRGRGEGFYGRGASYEEEGFGRGRPGRATDWEDG